MRRANLRYFLLPLSLKISRVLKPIYYLVYFIILSPFECLMCKTRFLYGRAVGNVFLILIGIMYVRVHAPVHARKTRPFVYDPKVSSNEVMRAIINYQLRTSRIKTTKPNPTRKTPYTSRNQKFRNSPGSCIPLR